MACKPVSKVKAMREEDLTPFRNPGLPGNLRNFVMNHYKLCIALISCKMRVELLLKEKNRGNYTDTHVVLHDGCSGRFLMCPALRSITPVGTPERRPGRQFRKRSLVQPMEIRENADFAFPTRDKNVTQAGSLTKAGCPTSRSFFARCGIPLHLSSNSRVFRCTERSTSVVSHISRKTSEMWGTRPWLREPAWVTFLSRVGNAKTSVFSDSIGTANKNRTNQGMTCRPLYNLLLFCRANRSSALAPSPSRESLRHILVR